MSLDCQGVAVWALGRNQHVTAKRLCELRSSMANKVENLNAEAARLTLSYLFMLKLCMVWTRTVFWSYQEHFPCNQCCVCVCVCAIATLLTSPFYYSVMFTLIVIHRESPPLWTSYLTHFSHLSPHCSVTSVQYTMRLACICALALNGSYSAAVRFSWVSTCVFIQPHVTSSNVFTKILAEGFLKTFTSIYFMLHLLLGHTLFFLQFLLEYLFVLCNFLFWFRNSLLFFGRNHLHVAGSTHVCADPPTGSVASTLPLASFVHLDVHKSLTG